MVFCYSVQIYDVWTHVLQRKFKSSVVIKMFWNNDMNGYIRLFFFSLALFANKEVTVFTKINNANRIITGTTFCNAIESLYLLYKLNVSIDQHLANLLYLKWFLLFCFRVYTARFNEWVNDYYRSCKQNLFKGLSGNRRFRR